MEKDHFKDRTKETTLITAIHIGEFAFLTKHDHPRGIKVKGTVYEPYKNGYKKTNREAIGRIVYLAEK